MYKLVDLFRQDGYKSRDPCATHGSATACLGGGVIWDGITFETPVIPAKAGIHSANLRKCAVEGLGSRFRGNDCGLQRPCLANDTSTLVWDTAGFICDLLNVRTWARAAGRIKGVSLRILAFRAQSIP
jgi:hypothetical protein